MIREYVAAVEENKRAEYVLRRCALVRGRIAEREAQLRMLGPPKARV